MNGLLSIQILSILNPKPKEITQLGRSINLSLPSIFPLAMHSQRHNLIPVLARDQVRSLEENARTISKRGRSPRLSRSKGSIDGSFDVRSGGIRVRRYRSMRGGVRLCEDLGALDFLSCDD